MTRTIKQIGLGLVAVALLGVVAVVGFQSLNAATPSTDANAPVVGGQVAQNGQAIDATTWNVTRGQTGTVSQSPQVP